MKVLVCIKQIPDDDSELVVDPASRRIIFSGQPAYRMNRYDEYAVEMALQYGQIIDHTRVEAISVGPERVDEVLRRALGMGANHGIQVRQQSTADRRPLAVATALADVIQRHHYDLVLTGALSEDEMNGTTGPMIAGLLGWPCATNVIASEPRPDEPTIQVEREIDGGDREILEVELPAVLTVQTGDRQPRYPRLSMMLRANGYPLEIFNLDRMAPATTEEKIIRMDYPTSSRGGVFLSGTLENKADELIRILSQRTLLP